MGLYEWTKGELVQQSQLLIRAQKPQYVVVETQRWLLSLQCIHMIGVAICVRSEYGGKYMWEALPSCHGGLSK